MSQISFRRGHPVRVAAFFLVLAALGMASATAAVFSTRCVRDAGPISDFLTYSLFVTVPTTGYHFKLLGTQVKNGVVKVELSSRLDPGLHGQVVMTHRIRFTLIAPRFASRYTVTVNGRSQGAARPILGS
jgi:hypothetical protein